MLKLPFAFNKRGLEIVVRISTFISGRSITDFKINNIIRGFVN